MWFCYFLRFYNQIKYMFKPLFEWMDPFLCLIWSILKCACFASFYHLECIETYCIKLY